MTREALDEKYSYQIDENNVVCLFRGEEDYQQYLTNPLLSAIFKIEALKKENEDLKEQCLILADCDTCYSPCKNENVEMKKQLTKAKELLTKWVELFKPKGGNIPPTPIQVETEQFLRELEE